MIVDSFVSFSKEKYISLHFSCKISLLLINIILLRHCFLSVMFLLALPFSPSSSFFLDFFFSPPAILHLHLHPHFSALFSLSKGEAEGGGWSWGARDPPPSFCKLFFVTLSKTLRGGRHDYLVITLRFT